MLHRRDTFSAAARFALLLRDVAIRHEGVSTIGNAVCTPGVVTAVPGVTEILVDQRHLDADVLRAMNDDARASPSLHEAALDLAGQDGLSRQGLPAFQRVPGQRQVRAKPGRDLLAAAAQFAHAIQEQQLRCAGIAGAIKQHVVKAGEHGRE